MHWTRMRPTPMSACGPAPPASDAVHNCEATTPAKWRSRDSTFGDATPLPAHGSKSQLMVVADESWDAYDVRDVCEVGGGVCVHGTHPLEHAGAWWCARVDRADQDSHQRARIAAGHASAARRPAQLRGEAASTGVKAPAPRASRTLARCRARRSAAGAGGLPAAAAVSARDAAGVPRARRERHNHARERRASEAEGVRPQSGAC